MDAEPDAAREELAGSGLIPPDPSGAESPPLPAWAREGYRPPLHAPVTLLCALVVLVYATRVALFLIQDEPLALLWQPARTLSRVADVDLDTLCALEEAAPAERALYDLFGGPASSIRRDLLRAYERTLDALDRDPEMRDEPWASALPTRWVILRAETQRGTIAEEQLARFAEGDLAFPRSIAFAYGPTPTGDTDVPPHAGDLEAGQDEWVGTWSYDRLRARVAERAGDAARRREAEGAIRARGLVLLKKTRALYGFYLPVVVAGLAVLALCRRRLLRPAQAATGMTVAPWSFAFGAGVLLRCMACAIGVEVGLAMTPLGRVQAMSLLTALPMLIIAQRYLFRPDGTTLWHGFGLNPGGITWRRLVLFALALCAVDQIGCMVIQGVVDVAGIDDAWEEWVHETILFGSGWEASLLFADGVLWAPLFEEIGFRGLLYVTLRTRLTPLRAACVSGALFGMVHLYSLPGFVQVFWSGIVLAVGYE